MRDFRGREVERQFVGLYSLVAHINEDDSGGDAANHADIGPRSAGRRGRGWPTAVCACIVGTRRGACRSHSARPSLALRPRQHCGARGLVARSNQRTVATTAQRYACLARPEPRPARRRPSAPRVLTHPAAGHVAGLPRRTRSRSLCLRHRPKAPRRRALERRASLKLVPYWCLGAS